LRKIKRGNKSEDNLAYAYSIAMGIDNLPVTGLFQKQVPFSKSYTIFIPRFLSKAITEFVV